MLNKLLCLCRDSAPLLLWHWIFILLLRQDGAQARQTSQVIVVRASAHPPWRDFALVKKYSGLTFNITCVLMHAFAKHGTKTLINYGAAGYIRWSYKNSLRRKGLEKFWVQCLNEHLACEFFQQHFTYQHSYVSLETRKFKRERETKLVRATGNSRGRLSNWLIWIKNKNFRRLKQGAVFIYIFVSSWVFID